LQSISQTNQAHWHDYYELTKPRVVVLIVFCGIVGMFLATPALPSLNVLFFGALGIGLSASSAAVINHVLDAQIDEKMSRTKNRPLPQGKISQKKALVFSFILCVISMLMLLFRINLLTTILTFFSLIGYAVIYTVYLKRATPQNIVIGGAAGAAPPVLGWTAVTGEVHSDALILFLIIFLWTPPHFWALAIARKDDYEKANIPMLPVTHGNAFTRLFILNYTILLVGITILPYQTGMSGLIYLVTAIISGAAFLWYAIKLKKDNDIELPMRVFRFSIHYLTILFTALLIDHYLPLRISDLLI
jgi:protoheme IX farnesyltransferase|tara:strand:+ start:197 stop:1105 length:909 start_codon:yes stop_codon:yes gene_type:complete